MKPDSREQYIGEVVVIEERLYARNIFSDDILFPLENNSKTIPPLPESIIQGQVLDGIMHVLMLLAEPQSVQYTLYKIAAEHNLNPLFSRSVMQEVETILANPGINDPALVDMEKNAFCTIDDAGTRDLDQALYIDKVKSNYRVFYALADAAYYVRPGTDLFNEALKRGSSYYLPGLMVPMLPRELCEGLISLNENVTRRAMVFELNLDESGVCIKTRIFRARIKSRAKLSFEKVQTFLDSVQQDFFNDSGLEASLKLFQEVGKLRLVLAEERNIVRYRRHEVNVKLGRDGFRFNILDDLRNNVEQYNEQLSLLCNVEGAKFLRKNDRENDNIHPIYRIHPRPPQAKISSFEQLLQSLIQVHHLSPEQWSWQQNSQQTLADYLAELPSTGSQSRIAQAIHRQAIMMNVRSSFSEEAAEHFGVGADVYARFSAPMREIVGVFLHKEVAEKQLSFSPELSKTEDDILREQVIKIANQSRSVQRKITHVGNKLVLDQMFHDDMQLTGDQRPSHIGTVIGINNRKIYVLLDKPKIDVKVYITHLESNLNITLSRKGENVVMYRSDSNEVFVRLGDSVPLYVKEMDQLKNRWVLLF